MLVASFFKQLGIGGSFVNMEHSSGTILITHIYSERMLYTRLVPRLHPVIACSTLGEPVIFYHMFKSNEYYCKGCVGL